MAAPYTAPMPPDLECFAGYTIRLTAVDPTTGTAVAGVNVSNLVIAIVTGPDTSPTDLSYGPFMLVPGPGA